MGETLDRGGMIEVEKFRKREELPYGTQGTSGAAAPTAVAMV